MKNADMNQVLLKAMNDLDEAFVRLKTTIDRYELQAGKSVNDIEGFVDYFPFAVDLSEINTHRWVEAVEDGMRRKPFHVLNYEYMNTGGNCMVGIFTVYLPERNQTVYVLANEEGCNLCTVDYISNDFGMYIDEFIIEAINYDHLDGTEKYFELYRYCLNEYTKSDCRYFCCTRAIPFRLLSAELQSEVHADYLAWLDEHGYDVLTDGETITVHPDYDSLFSDPHEEDEHLRKLKEFCTWHENLVNPDTCDEDLNALYDKYYRITFNGKRAVLPFNADTYHKIISLCDSVIREW